MGLGLLLRRLGSPLCLIAGLALAAWSLVHVTAGHAGGLPSLVPFDAGARVGFPIWIVEAVLALAVLFFGIRLLAVSIGATGWLLLPREHRHVLTRLTTPDSAAVREPKRCR